MKKILFILLLFFPFLLSACSREVAREIITDQFLRYHERMEAATLVSSGNYCRMGLDKKGIPVTAVTYISNTPWKKFYFNDAGRIIHCDIFPIVKNDTAATSIRYRYNENGLLTDAEYRYPKRESQTKQHQYDRYGLTDIRWLNSRGIIKKRTKVEYNFNDLTVTFTTEDGNNTNSRTFYFAKKKNRVTFLLYDTTMTSKLLPEEFQNRSVESTETYVNGKLTTVKHPKKFNYQ